LADQQKDSRPYQLYGRRTVHEPEVRVGSHDDLDRARTACNDMVDSGVWAHASVRDRNDQTVYVGEVAQGNGNGPPDDHLPPAA
jgi:hypothetical protein